MCVPRRSHGRSCGDTRLHTGTLRPVRLAVRLVVRLAVGLVVGLAVWLLCCRRRMRWMMHAHMIGIIKARVGSMTWGEGEE